MLEMPGAGDDSDTPKCCHGNELTLPVSTAPLPSAAAAGGAATIRTETDDETHASSVSAQHDIAHLFP
jgi:hypothetical protein